MMQSVRFANAQRTLSDSLFREFNQNLSQTPFVGWGERSEPQRIGAVVGFRHFVPQPNLHKLIFETGSGLNMHDSGIPVAVKNGWTPQIAGLHYSHVGIPFFRVRIISINRDRNRRISKNSWERTRNVPFT
jgi:hypothetical protein